MGDGAIAVYAAVAQEGPVAANVFDAFEIDFTDQHFFFVVGAFDQNCAEWITQERPAPELEAGARRRVSAHVAGFVPNAVHDGNIHAIGDGMGALNRFPGIVLGGAVLLLLSGMPADRSRIEQHLRALQ